MISLIVISCVTAAFTPVITKKLKSSMVVAGSTGTGVKTKTHEIDYGSSECAPVAGQNYCEGQFKVPTGFNGDMEITLLGAGGGGGGGATAGFVEWTTAGAKSFVVPNFTNKKQVEVTLVSGGGGGAAGGYVKMHETIALSNEGTVTATTEAQKATATDIYLPIKIANGTSGAYSWARPAIAQNRQVLISACGAGGGNGSPCAAGAGGYIYDKPVDMTSRATLGVIIGGRGGTPYANGIAGGGGGGAGDIGCTSGDGGKGGKNGGAAGTSTPNTNFYLARPGECGDKTLGDGSNCHGKTPASTSSSLDSTKGIAVGGAGNGGGAYYAISAPYGSAGAGAGAGSVLGYGGGAGGGSGCAAGGGGGGAATIVGTRDSRIYFAPGGGGGGSSTRFGGGEEFTGRDECAGGGGGGGGGVGGGYGGNGARSAINASLRVNCTNGGNGSGYDETRIKNTFGTGYCYANKNGAMRITYLDYGIGGSGGGAGFIVPVQPLSVTPGGTLSINVGVGQAGGTAAYINASGGITDASYGAGRAWSNTESTLTSIKSGSTMVMAASSGLTDYGKTWNSGSGGCPNGQSYYSSGFCGMCGRSVKGLSTNLNELINVSGFAPYNEHGLFGYGKSAGNIRQNESGTYNNKTTGGDGGVTKLFGQVKCTPGRGGTAAGVSGTAANGYGCGGGGGYGLSNGGAGGQGYARISWNKYWQAQENGGSYSLATTGSGTGGTSGSLVTFKLKVTSGQVIKFRIGKGGTGGHWENNTYTAATAGGDTIFWFSAANGSDAKFKAGGGGAGGGAYLSSASPYTLTNGTTGAIGTCKINGSNVTCTKSGIQGTISSNNYGGAGGNGVQFPSSSVGTGGSGGTTNSGTNANGSAASGLSAGGGGASLINLSDNLGPATAGATGGAGAAGKIYISWKE